MITLSWLSFVIWIVLGCLAAVSASSRGRSPIAWFLIGSLFGWYGLLLLFILPPVKSESLATEEKEQQQVSALPPIPETPKEYQPTGEWFFLDATKKVCGPLSPQMMKSAFKEGRILPESWVWNESTVDWKKLSEIQPLVDWLRA